MSAEAKQEVRERNIALLNDFLEFFSREGPGGLADEFDTYCHPNLEFSPGMLVLGRETHRGREEYIEYVNSLDDRAKEFDLDIEETRAVGDDFVLALGRVHFVGRTDEDSLDAEYGFLSRIEDGKFRQCQTFLSHAAAEKAADAQA